MESVEVWMWVIAGLAIGSIVLASGYSFLANYSNTANLNQAKKSMSELSNLVNMVCESGKNTQQTRNIIFPYITNEIYIFDEETGLKSQGNKLCVELSGQEAMCSELVRCRAEMKTVLLEEKQNLFYMVQQALGANKVSNLRFSVLNKGDNAIGIIWQREYVP